MLVDYFRIEPTREEEITTTYKDGRTETKTEERPNHLRFFSGFARENHLHIDTLNEWTRVYPEFSDAYKMAKELQKEHLITCGLLGLYQPAAYIFTAKNIAGMVDKLGLDEGTCESLASFIKSVANG